MRFTTLTYALLPLLAIAEDTTTLTSTATLTRTITVSEVVASVTATLANNSTSTFATATPVLTSMKANLAAASPSAATTKVIPDNYMGAASNLNSIYAGSASVLVMIAAALL